MEKDPKGFSNGIVSADTDPRWDITGITLQAKDSPVVLTSHLGYWTGKLTTKKGVTTGLRSATPGGALIALIEAIKSDSAQFKSKTKTLLRWCEKIQNLLPKE